MKNQNGVDTHYVSKNLDRLLHDYKGMPKDEVARCLLRIAGTVDQAERDRVIETERSSMVLRDGVLEGVKTIHKGIESYPAKDLARVLTRYAQALDFTVAKESEFQAA